MTLKGFFGHTPTAIILAVIISSLTFQVFAQEQKRVYRWVDENGEVHYTESLPPDYEGETHDELSHDGIVRSEDVSRNPPPSNVNADGTPAEDSGPTPAEIAQARAQAEKLEQMDRLLLLRYQTEEELLEARDVEVNQLKYDERLLSATHESLSTSLRSNIVTAGHRQRAGMDIPPETLNQIATIRTQLETNERSLRGLQMREDNVRAEFEQRLERYRELVELYSEDDT